MDQLDVEQPAIVGVRREREQAVGDRGGVGSAATAFGCAFGCGGTARLICCTGGSEGDPLTAAATNVPEVTLAAVVVNSAIYGGSGGPFAVLSTNSSSIDIGRHELGHTIAHLADEYSAPYPGYPLCDAATDCPEPNATLHAVRPGKWGPWVTASQPIPTPSGTTGIGYFEGCRYMTTGVYRPADTCIMNALGFPFCSVCAEAMSLAFWSHVHPIDTTTPATTSPIATTGCATQDFSVTLPANAGALATSWTVDGAAQSATTPTITLDANNFVAGTHTVVATIHDGSPLIRTDPQSLTSESATWMWSTTCAGMPHPDGGSGGGTAGGGCCNAADHTATSGLAALAVALVLGRRRRAGR